MNKKEAERMLSWCDSYQRMHCLFKIKGQLWPRTWLRLLGENWTLCDNIWRYRYRILNEKPISCIDGPVREMMTDEEWKELDEMPSQLEIFRGCYENVNEDGISYSLDPRQATCILKTNGYTMPGRQPILRHSLVYKDSVVAFKNDRGEREIIIRECQVLRDERLTTR